MDKLKHYHWGIFAAKSNKGKYIKYYASNGKAGFMHRYLKGSPKGKIVDHIDGSEFNNLDSNLRICTQEENGKNRKDNTNNISGHKGVCRIRYPSGTWKWKAAIKVGYIQHNLGFFDDYDEAVKVREEAELFYFREYSNLHNV